MFDHKWGNGGIFVPKIDEMCLFRQKYFYFDQNKSR